MNGLRSLFPMLDKKNLVYLDSAATSLKPYAVIQAINNYYHRFSVNSHSRSNNYLFNKVQKVIEKTRKIVAQKIKSQAGEIVFVPSATYGLNILALSLGKFIKKGDKIALTYLEHSSNLYPWQSIAKEKKAIVDYLPLNKSFVIDTAKLKNFIDKKTKIVSFCHVSNSLGVINPVKKIVQKIKEINPSCLVVLDACQSIVNANINASKFNIDALVFSGHKTYGPTGIGVL